LSDADVVTCYLLQSTNQKLEVNSRWTTCHTGGAGGECEQLRARDRQWSFSLNK
jgi:hypothetical protein